ncbi:hypothetical protein GCM10017788_37690 [Amycolatopsis acidiphila]|nr:hypothetical protein GCM10017788_37690 [Amycolatopsis acidiphila]
MELAKAGYILGKGPQMRVDFEIHHLPNSPGYFRDLMAQEQEGSGFVEALSSSANGVGIVIGTRTGLVDSARGGRHAGTGESLTIDRNGRNVFSGIARPNPSFTFESVRTFEGVISISGSEAATVDFRRALLIKEVIAYTAKLAAEVAGVPLLSAQWPAQVPPKMRGKPGVQHVHGREEGPPPHASSHAIRFALALGESSAETRMRLGRHLAEFALERGFGLWLADSRVGHRTGNWFHVASLAPSRTAGYLAQDNDREQITVCLPVTLVGPARIGSTHTLMGFLSSLPFVGVVACSNTTLDDLAFIHLQLVIQGLGVRDLVAKNKALKELANEDSQDTNPVQAFLRILRALECPEVAPIVGTRQAKPNPAFDYRVLAGSLFPCLPKTTRRRVAVWFSWQVKATEDALLTIVDRLYAAFAQIRDSRHDHWHNPEDHPNIEYLICRQFNYSVLRGKGKISVPKDVIDHYFKNEVLEQPVSRFCADLEARWRSELNGLAGLVELTVAWRESWLGNWMSSL